MTNLTLVRITYCILVTTGILLGQRNVAVFPFESDSHQTDGIASRVESGIRQILLRSPNHNVVEREALLQVLNEQNYMLFGLTEEVGINAGKMLGAQGLIFGEASNLLYGDSYVKQYTGISVQAEEYRRFVSFTISVRVVDVFSGNVIWERSHSFDESETYYRNLVQTEPEQSNYARGLKSTLEDENAGKFTKGIAALAAIAAMAGDFKVQTDALDQNPSPIPELMNTAVQKAVAKYSEYSY